MRELLVAPEAREELDLALDWYEGQRPGLGRDLLAAVGVAVTGLLAGDVPTVPLPGSRRRSILRRALVDGFPYSVIASIEQSRVHVLAFAHHKRRPGYWRARARGARKTR